FSLACAGDVNGDGFSDIIVWASSESLAAWTAGRAYLYYGSARGLSPTPDWVAGARQPSSRFGHCVASAGDVNGDGFADVVITTMFWDVSPNQYGWVFVYHGSTNGLGSQPDWQVRGNHLGPLVGYCAAAAGDVNGDGFDDLIVGCVPRSNGPGDAGEARVYYGSTNGLAAEPAWRVSLTKRPTQFGQVVAGAGDVNGDGFDDVIVSAPNYGYELTEEGRVWIYHGSRKGLSQTASWSAEGKQTAARFGYACGAAGDVNGDAYDDVFIGAYSASHGEVQEGRVFVYYGSRQGLKSPNWIAEGNQRLSSFGYSAGAAGDVNGDGFADLIVGARTYKQNFYREGKAWLFLGSSSGLETNPVWSAVGGAERAEFGSPVATAGDINHDGYADFLIGGLNYPIGSPGPGRVFARLGAATGWRAIPDTISAMHVLPPPPPWWRTGWFLGGGVVLLLAAGLWMVRQVELRRVRRQMQALERERDLELERIRIAQDIHDQLGATLTSIALLGDLVSRKLAQPEQAAEAVAHVRRIGDSAREAAQSLDEIVWAADPRRDSMEGLVNYLSTYVAEFLAPTAIRCRVDLPQTLPALPVRGEVRHALYLFVKEALHNVVKHAAATEVRLSLKVEPACLHLAVADDGRGFVTGQIGPGGNGLLNMRQRIEKLGGQFALTTAVGAGTRLEVRLALSGPA
ncbi:MAG: FG-GAP repeat protein, partial [Verrucomicrobia bacterium]|nr:FG-GAP repeat protein [Verrucomicrobiota bacterium]